uniref:C3H1-type domain-containing protein n=1 Tax=Romanomermis culicivorax TaxID=13658 RepID=A0A915I9F6_ROMCU
MARLTALIGRLTAQPTAWMGVQNTGDHPSEAHLQMCSYHGPCTHNDANCRAQHPHSTALATPPPLMPAVAIFVEREHTGLTDATD